MDANYTRTAIWLHWLIAIFLVGQFLFGWYLTGVPRGTPDRGYFVNLHKSTGLVIGFLIFLRLAWRMAHQPPPLPDTVPRWQQSAAAQTHRLLYVLMVVMPLSGYLASNFSKFGVHFFNTLQLAPWGTDSKLVYAIFNQTHKVTAWLLLALVLVHVLAAFKHLLVDHDAIFSRMWPNASRHHDVLPDDG
jgi:cytochrome b561